MAAPTSFFGMATTYFRLFRQRVGRRIYLLIALTALMGYAEGIGIALFLPLFATNANGADGLTKSLLRVFEWMHIEYSPRAVLPFIVVIFVVKGLLQFATFAYQYWLATRLTLKVRREVMAGFSKVEYRYIAEQNSGTLTNLIVNEVPRFSQAFLYFSRAIPPGLSAFIFLTIVFALDWRLTLACLSMGAVLTLVLRVTGRISRQYSDVTTRENGRLTTLLIQTLQAFKYLRATASFDKFGGQVDQSARGLADADLRSGIATSVTLSVPQPVMVLFVACIIYYRSIVTGAPLASLFILLMYFLRIATELYLLQTQWQVFCSYVGSVELIRSTVASLDARAEKIGGRAFSGLTQAITADSVSFSYEADGPILSDISLTIPRNAAVAFVGESGAGKSTMVDLLTGTLRTTQGSVRYDGEELSTWNLDDVRRRIGYVTQDCVIFDDTVANNISLWAARDEARLRSAAERALCRDFIEKMPQGFEERLGERGVRLSGGQRQRLAVARELYRQPDILVLDEATSALDSESERAIQASLDRLRGQLTILVIAHRLSTIRACDCIYVLHEGRIVEQGSFDELVAIPNGRFRRMWELQQ